MYDINGTFAAYQINATVLEVQIYFLNLYFTQSAIFEKVTKPKYTGTSGFVL
jgi:hypothetical protein